MDEHIIEKKISPLIASQFPSFYQEQGPVFIQFVKAYYEWLETEGQVLYKGRRLIENTDIDLTLDKFLEYFQKKFLYGIPFDVIINKRFLLKHVLDAYRSKSSEQCFKLLFRLIFNQDVDLYIPSVDMLRLSDGDWIEPKYIEVTNVDGVANLVGKTIVGLSSETTAVVESFITEPFNSNILSTLYLSNVSPRGADFITGEKVIEKEKRTSNNLFEIVSAAPTVLGSLDYINIINGGIGFKVGDLLKIANRDIDTNEIISLGTEGVVRVSEIGIGAGSIAFNITSGGFGIKEDANVFIYNNPLDTTGTEASFQLGTISDTQIIEYNTDLIADYADLTLNTATFGFTGNASANVDTPLEDYWTFETGSFGSLASLDTVRTGENYTAPVDIFVRSAIRSNAMAGTVSFNTTSANVTGTGTSFQTYLTTGDVVCLQANSSNTSTAQNHVVRSVTNNTFLTLYGKPSLNSTASAVWKLAPPILPANYPTYDPLVVQNDQTVAGLNTEIEGVPSVGTTVVKHTTGYVSGKGYSDGEPVKLYRYGAVVNPTIVDGGAGYANGEYLVFAGADPTKIASGYISTNTSGGITGTTITDYGAGYEYEPTVLVKTANGTGAYLTTTIQGFDDTFEVTGRVVKRGMGQGRGYWATTASFLNADKYIQDSYFYQDYSYQLRAAQVLQSYKNILYNTFHISGTEMFGEFVLTKVESSNVSIISETVTVA